MAWSSKVGHAADSNGCVFIILFKGLGRTVLRACKHGDLWGAFCLQLV